MAHPSTSQPPVQDGRQTVYFAFGSNLHLSQMATRCPESRYVGRGKLEGYKWQINSRGYANISPSPNDTVLGLCFLLSRKDEERLDINEGVSSGAYQKYVVSVEIVSANPSIAGRRVKEVHQYINGRDGAPMQHLATRGESVNCLTYANLDITENGRPREEYRGRIAAGVADAKKLGVSQQYFDKYFAGPMEW